MCILHVLYIFYAGFFAILSKDDPFGLDGIPKQEMVMMGCHHGLQHNSKKQGGDCIPSSAKWISVSPCPEDSTIKNPPLSQTLFPAGSNLPVIAGLISLGSIHIRQQRIPESH